MPVKNKFSLVLHQKEGSELYSTILEIDVTFFLRLPHKHANLWHDPRKMGAMVSIPKEDLF